MKTVACEFALKCLMQLTVARIHDKFEAKGTMHDVHREISGRPCTATSPTFSAVMLEQFMWSPQKSAKQYALWE
jgi:hypothetical protein